MIQISVEGNIGAGKSSFVKFFEEICENVETLPEPVSMWSNCNGNNILQLMYTNPHKYGIVFQSLAVATILDRQRIKQLYPIRLIERSILCSKNCFTIAMVKNGSIKGPDHKIISKLYNSVTSLKEVKPDKIIYLRCEPEVCLERIKNRNRVEETGIPLEYLKQIHDLHEDWLMKGKSDIPVTVINCDKSWDEMMEVYKVKKDEILQLPK